jgi:hypothetical protein
MKGERRVPRTIEPEDTMSERAALFLVAGLPLGL